MPRNNRAIPLLAIAQGTTAIGGMLIKGINTLVDAKRAIKVQVIMVIVCIIVAFIVLYYCCKKFRQMRTLFKYYFLFLTILRILRTSCRTDLFIEVTNMMKGNTVWAHFMATGYFPTNIHLSRPIPKESVKIETRCCIFKQMIIDWMNTEVTGISDIRIEMPNEAKISIFTDNDLTNITDDHFEINLSSMITGSHLCSSVTSTTPEV